MVFDRAREAALLVPARSDQRSREGARVEDGKALEVYAFFKRQGKYSDYLRFMKSPEQANLVAQIAKADAAFVEVLRTT